MIIGVDGGATSALAVLDYDGNVIALASRKSWGASEIIEAILKLAADSPIVVACDVNPASKLARHIKASFRAKLFYPPRSLGQLEKMHLVEKHLRVKASRLEPKNVHERDALAAAVKAYHNVQNKMRQTRAKAAGFAEEQVKVAQADVLRGRKMAVALRR